MSDTENTELEKRLRARQFFGVQQMPAIRSRTLSLVLTQY